MNIEEAKRVCETLQCVARRTIRIDNNGDIGYSRWTFFYANMEQIRKNAVALKLGNMEKRHYNGISDIDLIGSDFTFSSADKCKITGYKNVHVEAHDKKVPIYQCDTEEES